MGFLNIKIDGKNHSWPKLAPSAKNIGSAPTKISNVITGRILWVNYVTTKVGGHNMVKVAILHKCPKLCFKAQP